MKSPGNVFASQFGVNKHIEQFLHRDVIKISITDCGHFSSFAVVSTAAVASAELLSLKHKRKKPNKHWNEEHSREELLALSNQ